MSRGSRKPQSAVQMNAGDPRAVRAAEKREAEQQRALREAYKAILATSDGRLVLWDILDKACVFRTSFDPNGSRMAFNEGARNLGLSVLAAITAAKEDAFLTMQREARDRARATT